MSPYGKNIMYVYIIQSGHKKNSPVKIGMSDDPEKRIKQLQTGNPLELRILLSIRCKSREHAFSLENTLHSLLASSNIMNEWFSMCRSRMFKTINELANDPNFSQVQNNIGLFSKRTTEENRKAKLENRPPSVESLYIQIENLIKKNKTQVSHSVCMEASLTKRRKEATIFRNKLIELGFKGNFDELLDRK